MIPRQAHKTVEKLASSYPVVAITGPRQSGKTTLVQAVFKDKPYISLEDLDNRGFASSDPRGFLEQFKYGAILDEVQRVPDLFSYLQTRVDKDRQTGQFILTGSQQFGLLSGITQSLAGRVGLLSLLPFTLEELNNAGSAPQSLEELLYRGLYPAVYDRPHQPANWYDNYVRTYIERDVRQILNIRDLVTFRLFVRMCAARTGQLLNLSSLASDCGINHNTAKAWISVLEASYVIHLLQPFHSNINKRLVKSPKLYFHDCGLAAWLLGIHSAEQLAVHSQRGHLFETWAVSELLKARYNMAMPSNLYFWRNRSGLEVDILMESRETLYPIELKSGKTVATDFTRSLDEWRRISGDKGGKGCLVYGGDTGQSRENLEIISWKNIGKIQKASQVL